MYSLEQPCHQEARRVGLPAKTKMQSTLSSATSNGCISEVNVPLTPRRNTRGSNRLVHPCFPTLDPAVYRERPTCPPHLLMRSSIALLLLPKLQRLTTKQSVDLENHYHTVRLVVSKSYDGPESNSLGDITGPLERADNVSAPNIFPFV